MTTRVCILGAGSWGVTLADLLASKAFDVHVWDPDGDALAVLRRERSRGKPPGLRVHEAVIFEDDFGVATSGADVIVCVAPSFAVRSVCKALTAVPQQLGRRIFVNCSKGIEETTLLLPSQIFEEFFGEDAAAQYAVLSGPSHAEEVCRRIPTTVVSCSRDQSVAKAVRDLFMIPTFRVYTQSDVRGVELGAALKNVIAIAAGISDGLGFGDNTKAALMTRGLAEIARAGRALGAQPETLAGLAGLGDLIVTAMSRHSRNRGFGELLAKGRTPEQALKEIGMVVEGYTTSRSAHDLARKIGVEMPMTDAVYSAVHEGASVKNIVETLLTREPKPEIY